jgi:hypothetical protein
MVEIKSSSGGRSLVFSERDGDDFRVAILGDEVTAKKRIWGHSDSHLLIDLFEFMAENWKGWEGDKKWQSIESDLCLTASTDNWGHITLGVSIHANHPDDDWSAQAPIHLDAGSLDTLLKDIRAFFA